MGKLSYPKRYPHEAVFALNIHITEDGCWQWTGNRNDNGYGLMPGGGRGRRPQRAHRFAYERYIGPIPDGLVIDHLCRNRLCVNPEHLEPVTHRENILRGESPTALPYEGDNLYLYAKASGRLGRQCRTCSHLRYLARRGRSA